MCYPFFKYTITINPYKTKIENKIMFCAKIQMFFKKKDAFIIIYLKRI